MAFDHKLRHLKERVLKPVARQIGTTIHPTTLSLVGFCVGLGCVLLAYHRLYALALLLWLINRTIDGLDGVLARMTNRQSDFGGYVDILTDFVIYALIPSALAIGQNRVEVYAALACLLTSFYVNSASWMYLSSLLEGRNRGGEYTSVTMPVGLIEGAETILFYVTFFILPDRLVTLYLLMAGMVGITILQRVWWAYRETDF